MFLDHNADSVQNLAATDAQPALDPGIATASVSAKCVVDTGVDDTLGTADDVYDTAGPVTSDASGNYAIDVPGSPCRVTTALPEGYFDGLSSSDEGASVRFAAAGADLDFAVSDPAGFCQDNPSIVTACFRHGRRDSSINSGGSVYTIPWNAQGFNASHSPGTADPDPASIPRTATSENGMVWGMGWAPAARRVLAAANLRRHADLR